MEIKIGVHDVKITSKQFWDEKRSKEGTLEFLSYLSTAFYEASQWNREHGYDATADRLKKEGYELYLICKNAGLYKDLEKH
jgi:hypothetical protein